MTTKSILIGGGCIAAVVLMVLFGKLADGKSDDAEKKDNEQKN